MWGWAELEGQDVESRTDRGRTDSPLPVLPPPSSQHQRSRPAQVGGLISSCLMANGVG